MAYGTLEKKNVEYLSKKLLGNSFRTVELLVKPSKDLLLTYNFHFADVFVIYTYFFNIGKVLYIYVSREYYTSESMSAMGSSLWKF